MKIAKIKPLSALSLYQKCLLEAGFKNPINSQSKYLKYRKVFRVLCEKEDWENRIKLITKFYNELKEMFPGIKYFYYGFPHPELFLLDDVVNAAYWLEKREKKARKIEGKYIPEIASLIMHNELDKIVELHKGGAIWKRRCFRDD